MTIKKKNPNLCTTVESLTKGFHSVFRISGLFEGKARLCTLIYYGLDDFQAVTITGKPVKRIFDIADVKKGNINIMCIERGE